MVFSILWFLYNTLTNGIFLFRNSFTSRAKISTGSSSYVKSGLSSIVSEETTCDGSDRYLPNVETWKTLWILSKSEGKAKRYAIGPTFFNHRIWTNGSRAQLAPFFSQISSPSPKAILPKTLLSPISYRTSFLFMSE